jgi:hypothetical protein
MMSTTLLQGQDFLATQAGVLGNKDFPDSLLTYFLNISQRYVQKALNGLGLKKFEQSYDATANLTAGKYNGQNIKIVTMVQIKTGSTYDVGIYPNSIRLIECGNGASIAASTDFGVAKPADEQVFHSILSSALQTPTIKAPRFCWQDNQLLISPSTVTACIIHFYRVIKDLTQPADVFEIPDEFIDFVIKRAKIEVFDRLKLLDNKDEAIKALDNEIKDQFNSFQASMAVNNQAQQPASLS